MIWLRAYSGDHAHAAEMTPRKLGRMHPCDRITCLCGERVAVSTAMIVGPSHKRHPECERMAKKMEKKK